MVFYRPPEPIEPKRVQEPMPELMDEEQEQERPESEKRIRWIQESTFPGADKYSDGISDLFTVDTTDDTSDLIEVDIDRDIVDVNERGDLSDLVEVSEEDVMGDEETGQIPLDYTPDDERIMEQFNGLDRKPRNRPAQRKTPIRRYEPPTSLGGMRG